jgi:hypothetical protein
MAVLPVYESVLNGRERTDGISKLVVSHSRKYWFVHYGTSNHLDTCTYTTFILLIRQLEAGPMTSARMPSAAVWM